MTTARVTRSEASRGADVSAFRVCKKLAPSSRGAITLASNFGESLVCVRHRVDPEARYRYTTVELLVEKSEVRVREPKMVHIRLQHREAKLRVLVLAAGGKWDFKLKLWVLPKRVVTVLRLTHRIVQTP